MSEMIERVALAIMDLEGPSFEEMARAAIQAMREPTYEMEQAAIDLTTQFHGRPAIWRAMIDEALK